MGQLSIDEKMIERASRIDVLLEELQSELKSAIDLDRVALNALGVDRLGGLSKVYSDEAFESWSKKYAMDRENVETIHHLAIMHHARAIDLEQSKNPHYADKDWEESLDKWYTLWQSDVFWKNLASRACKKDDSASFIDELRAALPLVLLRIHYEIAIDEKSPLSRSNYHVRFALNAPFPDEIKEIVRNEAYEKVASVIPDEIWTTWLPEIGLAEDALNVIKRFLRIDKACKAALKDAINVLARILSKHTQEVNTNPDDRSGYIKIFEALEKLHKEWIPYIELIHEQSQEFRMEIQENLFYWCKGLAPILEGNGAISEAISCIKLLLKWEDIADADTIQDLNSRLSSILTKQAIGEANRALEGNSSPSSRLNALNASKERLEEAISLDKNNQHAKDNLEAINQTIKTQRSNTLIDQAISEANNALKGDNSPSSRLDTLVSSKRKLEEVLSFDENNKRALDNIDIINQNINSQRSYMLTDQAIGEANKAMKNIVSRSSMLNTLEASKKLLNEAVALDKNNKHAQENLDAINKLIKDGEAIPSF